MISAHSAVRSTDALDSPLWGELLDEIDLSTSP